MHQLNRSSKALRRYLPNPAKSPVTSGKLALRNTLYLLFLNPPNKRKQDWRATDRLSETSSKMPISQLCKAKHQKVLPKIYYA